MDPSSSASQLVDSADGGYVVEFAEVEVETENSDDGFRTITARKIDFRRVPAAPVLRRFRPLILHSGCRAGGDIDARLGGKRRTRESLV